MGQGDLPLDAPVSRSLGCPGVERVEDLGPQLRRRRIGVGDHQEPVNVLPVPEDPAQLLEFFPGGLTSQEVAACLTAGNDPVDREAAERAMLELLADGRATRMPLGDDAIWAAA